MSRTVLSRGADGEREYGVAEGPGEPLGCYDVYRFHPNMLIPGELVLRCGLYDGHDGKHQVRFHKGRAEDVLHYTRPASAVLSW